MRIAPNFVRFTPMFSQVAPNFVRFAPMFSRLLPIFSRLVQMFVIDAALLVRNAAFFMRCVGKLETFRQLKILRNLNKMPRCWEYLTLLITSGRDKFNKTVSRPPDPLHTQFQQQKMLIG